MSNPVFDWWTRKENVVYLQDPLWEFNMFMHSFGHSWGDKLSAKSYILLCFDLWEIPRKNQVCLGRKHITMSLSLGPGLANEIATGPWDNFEISELFYNWIECDVCVAM